MIFRKSYTDEQIINQIKEGGMGREAVLHYLFVDSGWRVAAVRLIRSLGGSSQDAEDAVQEAFVVFDHHIRCDQYKQIGGLKNYFLGICRGRWYSNRRKVRRLVFSDNPTSHQPLPGDDPEDRLLESERREHFRAVLHQLDPRCRELLSLIRVNYSMKEIAQAFNLGNENNARQRVFQCRQRLAKLLKQNPFLNEDLP